MMCCWVGVISVMVAGAMAAPAAAAELHVERLSSGNRSALAPRGKEADSIDGDWVLSNGRVHAVIGNPIAGRDANLSTHDVGGHVIDLTLGRDNDQLTAFYAAPRRWPLRSARVLRAGEDRVVLACRSAPAPDRPDVEVRYTLERGWDWLLIETTFENSTDSPIEIPLLDELRTDRTFAMGDDGAGGLVWTYDRWWGCAYGVAPERTGVAIRKHKSWMGPYHVTYGEGARRMLAPRERFTLTRRLIPADHALGVRAVADRLARRATRPVILQVSDPSGPVSDTDVWVTRGDSPYAAGRTGGEGTVRFDLPEGDFRVRVLSPGRGEKSFAVEGDASVLRRVALGATGRVRAQVTDAHGAPIPCKVQFLGVDGTKDPMFFPDCGGPAVKNAYYSHNGRFEIDMPAGRYRTVVSYGPEHDAVFGRLEVTSGRTSTLSAKLVRTVDTTGWISTEFHSHSSPSGDNTASQFGRVLNLLCEQIDFAPCTEHQRVDSYAPILKQLYAEKRMATCSGIELTGSPGDVNHQNAFPLRWHAHTQNGGGPRTDRDPVRQVKRLAGWDDGAEKLVQQNHPNLIRYAYDRDLDGKHDGGYAEMLDHIEAVEIHPIERILQKPTVDDKGVNRGANDAHAWLQWLNDGITVTGVVNTDAHYNFHGSGWRRNWVRSATDDPSAVRPLDVVEAVQHGHVVMSNGPFMEVGLRTLAQGAGAQAAMPGEHVVAPQGRAVLSVRVQCPNWFDIDRVQVLINGRSDARFNFTRRTHPQFFARGVVKFDREILLKLRIDAHVIVVAVGEHSTLGEVMGPSKGKLKPVAVSNPIFVDANDDGVFTPSRDALDAPLPSR